MTKRSKAPLEMGRQLTDLSGLVVPSRIEVDNDMLSDVLGEDEMVRLNGRVLVVDVKRVAIEMRNTVVEDHALRYKLNTANCFASMRTETDSFKREAKKSSYISIAVREILRLVPQKESKATFIMAKACGTYHGQKIKAALDALTPDWNLVVKFMLDAEQDPQTLESFWEFTTGVEKVLRPYEKHDTARAKLTLISSVG